MSIEIKGRALCLLHRVHLGVVTDRSAGVKMVGLPSSEQGAVQRNLALTKLLPKLNTVNMAPALASQSQKGCDK